MVLAATRQLGNLFLWPLVFLQVLLFFFFFEMF